MLPKSVSTPTFVHAYCWELTWDSVAGQRHAEQAEPADAKPAVAEDKPAEEADDKPAELQAQEPAEQAEDVEPADAEDAKPAELHQEGRPKRLSPGTSFGNRSLQAFGLILGFVQLRGCQAHRAPKPCRL